MLAATAFAVWAFLSWFAAVKMPARSAVHVFCLAPVVFMLSVNFMIPNESGEGKMPGRFLREHAGLVDARATVFSDERAFRAVCWYLGRSDIVMAGRAGELSYGLSYPDAAGRMMTVSEMVDLIRSAERTTDVAVIVSSTTVRRWVEQGLLADLPIPTHNGEADGYVVAVFGRLHGRG